MIILISITEYRYDSELAPPTPSKSLLANNLEVGAKADTRLFSMMMRKEKIAAMMIDFTKEGKVLYHLLELTKNSEHY